MAKHVLFVCRSCSFSTAQREYMHQRGGRHLLNHLLRLHQTWKLQSEFLLQEADCLSACTRPCAVAYAASGKTTLMFGDLPPLQSATAILKVAEQYYVSLDGIVSRRERPEILKKGILARIPPLPNHTS